VHRAAAALPAVRTGRPLPVGRHLTRVLVSLLAGLVIAAVLGAAASLARGSDAQSTWTMQSPVQPRRTGTFRNPRLTESSGVAASRRQPGVLWTLNDSGNGPWIFATDTLGGDLGAFRVSGAGNDDWEAIALGPCGRRECLYIADTGDNVESRGEVRIYRVPEPVLPAKSPTTPPAETLALRYPDGPGDVEAMFVGSDGTVFLIRKGRYGTAPAYRVPARAWMERGTVVAEALGGLQIDTGGLGNLVTDAALSPTGDRVAIRTYLAVFLFTLTRRNTLLPLGLACDTAGLQLQGEGISWLDDREMVLTSEGGFGTPGTIVVLGCGSG
jgi:hypothetical protein